MDFILVIAPKIYILHLFTYYIVFLQSDIKTPVYMMDYFIVWSKFDS